VFFRQCKALFTPLLLAIIVVLGLDAGWSPFSGATGRFIWETLLGMAFGCVLALMPLLYSAGPRERFVTQRWFACGLLAAVIVYQYLAQLAGLRVPWLQWLNTTSNRVLFAEGCLLGYCMIGALRARR